MMNSIKTILTLPLRHKRPKVVMENHTHTPAVHGKSFHNFFCTRFIIFAMVDI
jgi:hypothetical protein